MSDVKRTLAFFSTTDLYNVIDALGTAAEFLERGMYNEDARCYERLAIWKKQGATVLALRDALLDRGLDPPPIVTKKESL